MSNKNRENRRAIQLRARKEAERLLKKHGRSAKKIAREMSQEHFDKGHDAQGDYYHMVGNEIRMLARRRSRNPSDDCDPRVKYSSRRWEIDPRRNPHDRHDTPDARVERAQRTARRRMRGSTIETYEVSAVNRGTNQVCELEVDASSARSAIRLALSNLPGHGWEVTEVELKD